MVNFSSSQYDLINFTQQKKPNEVIKISDTQYNSNTQLARYQTNRDPAIGVGLQSTTERHEKPCYTEYAISSF